MIGAADCFFRCSMRAGVTRMVPRILGLRGELRGECHQSAAQAARSIGNLHDTGVVDQDVELRILGDELLCHRGDALRVLKVQLDRDHSGIRLRRYFQMRSPATGNDDLVPAFVQRLRQATSDPRTTACDENRVACENHRLFPFRQTGPERIRSIPMLRYYEPPSSIGCAKILRVARILHRTVQYVIMSTWGDRRTSAGKAFWRRRCLCSGNTVSRIPACRNWKRLRA